MCVPATFGKVSAFISSNALSALYSFFSGNSEMQMLDTLLSSPKSLGRRLCFNGFSRPDQVASFDLPSRPSTLSSVFLTLLLTPPREASVSVAVFLHLLQDYPMAASGQL